MRRNGEGGVIQHIIRVWLLSYSWYVLCGESAIYWWVGGERDGIEGSVAGLFWVCRWGMQVGMGNAYGKVACCFSTQT